MGIRHSLYRSESLLTYQYTLLVLHQIRMTESLMEINCLWILPNQVRTVQVPDMDKRQTSQDGICLLGNNCDKFDFPDTITDLPAHAY